MVNEFNQKKRINFDKIVFFSCKDKFIKIILRLITSFDLDIEWLNMKIVFPYND